MNEPIAYGIDFGTTNSSIAVAYRDRVEPLGLLTDPGVESKLYLDSTGQRLVGDEAVQQYLLGFDPTQNRLMSWLKSELATPGLRTQRWKPGEFWEMEDLVGFIIRDLKNRADAHLGANVERVVIGHPVVFQGVEGKDASALQRLAMSRLKKAASFRRGGFREVLLMDEPTAALRHDDLITGTNVALDFGGGTFDVSVVQYRTEADDLIPDVLATHGGDIGGEEFDGYVFDLALRDRLGFADLRWGDSIEQARTTDGMLHLVRDANALSRLSGYIQRNRRSGLRILERIVRNGHSFDLSKAVEDAKKKLSRKTTAPISLVRQASLVNINENCSRADFERKIADDVDQVFEVVQIALEDAGMVSSEVDRVILTGGSSQIPSFRKRASSGFRNSRIDLESSASRVSLGLAERARECWA